MQLHLTVTGADDVKELVRDFSGRRLNAAIATTLTRVAVKVRDKLQGELQRAIDNPTPYTRRQLRYAAATADRPVAAVGFDILAVQDVFGNTVRFESAKRGTTPAGKYMAVQAEGGSRRMKRFERALQKVGALPEGWLVVPGGRAKKDAFGNQSPGEIRQVLSWFDAAELVAGSRQNMGTKGRDKRRKGTRKTAGFEYFVVPVGRERDGLTPGIYRRTKFAFGSRVEPVMIFIDRANYRPRFDFYRIANQEAARLLPSEFHKAINESAQRKAARG